VCAISSLKSSRSLSHLLVSSCSPRESVGVCFYGVGLSVCMSVTTITKKIVDGFVPNFMGRCLGEKGRPSSCFVTIGVGMWK